MYAFQRHIYDVSRKYYLLGRDRLIEGLAPPPGGRVLEVGCGTARNLIVAARCWPEARFYGFDISDEMLRTARHRVARAGLSHRITLARGDAADFETETLLGQARFDRVFFSYTLSMIPDWQAAIATGCRALAPDGRLSIVDFGPQQRWPGWWRSFLFAWLAHWHVTPREALPTAIEAITGEHGWRSTVSPMIGGYAVMATIERPSLP